MKTLDLSFRRMRYRKKIQQLLPDATVEIVNYVPHGLRYNYFSEPELQKRYENKKSLFDQFRKDVINITTDEFTEEGLKLNRDYDYLISGSDQVWNPEITKLDPVYFLAFADEKSHQDFICCQFGSKQKPSANE